jgi:hypothetical protein
MLRVILVTICMVNHVCPAFGQTIPSDDQREAALLVDLKAFGKSKRYAFYDTHRSWSFDANCDGRDDRLVQVAFSVSGGNGVAVHYFIYEELDGKEKRIAEVDLSGGIKNVARSGSDLILTMSQHRVGDPMCCPSGQVRQRLSMCHS